MSANDLTEESLLKLLKTISEPLYHTRDHFYVTCSSEQLRIYGWSDEEIAALRELERTCLP